MSDEAEYLFSMMLGLAVTKCVLVPTSFTYSFESGGRLHLNGGNVQHSVTQTLHTMKQKESHEIIYKIELSASLPSVQMIIQIDKDSAGPISYFMLSREPI